jgi:hypothetical protein
MHVEIILLLSLRAVATIGNQSFCETEVLCHMAQAEIIDQPWRGPGK